MNNTQLDQKITILGIGNTLYTDEGVGIAALELLEDMLKDVENIEIMDGATDGMRLLGPIEESDYLIIVDAINAAGAEPGTIITLRGDEIPAYYGIKMSVHQLGFQEVLLAAKMLGNYPKHIVMMGMQPTSLELGVGLSEHNQSRLPELAKCIADQVYEWRNTHEPA